MIKFFCDVCSKEIKPGDENGELKYVEKDFQFIKHQKESAIKQIQVLLCDSCLKGLKEYLKGQKNIQ